jgi:hypothetical protein
MVENMNTTGLQLRLLEIEKQLLQLRLAKNNEKHDNYYL